MALDMYLQLNDGKDYPGDATAKGFENWIEVQAFSWGVEAESSFLKGGGASVGKPQPSEITIAKPVDRASARLLALIGRGLSVPKGVLVIGPAGRAGGAGSLRFTFENMFVTKIDLSASDGDGGVSESVSFVFKKITEAYTPTSGKDAVATTWDIAAGKIN